MKENLDRSRAVRVWIEYNGGGVARDAEVIPYCDSDTSGFALLVDNEDGQGWDVCWPFVWGLRYSRSSAEDWDYMTPYDGNLYDGPDWLVLRQPEKPEPEFDGQLVDVFYDTGEPVLRNSELVFDSPNDATLYDHENGVAFSFVDRKPEPGVRYSWPLVGSGGMRVFDPCRDEHWLRFDYA